MPHKTQKPEPVDAASTDTRARIVAAARTELVNHGFAGARVDRIAKRAGTSKERIYFYFKSKAEIAREIQQAQTDRFAAQVRFEPDDIETFIGDVFDYYYNNQEDVRLWLWFLLEMGDAHLPPDDFRVKAINKRVETVREGQALGHIHPDWDPVELLNLIASMALSPVLAPNYVKELGDHGDPEERRKSIKRQRDVIKALSQRILKDGPTAATS